METEPIDEDELKEDLILQNRTLEALIRGLEGDIEIFKNDNKGEWTPSDIVRFTMQLNVMRDKIDRNSKSINDMIIRQMSNKAHT
jgi:hypothetical protein